MQICASFPVTEGVSTSQVRVSVKSVTPTASLATRPPHPWTPRSRRYSLRLVFSSVFSVLWPMIRAQESW